MRNQMLSKWFFLHEEFFLNKNDFISQRRVFYEQERGFSAKEAFLLCYKLLKNLMRHNRKRHDHHYRLNNWVIVTKCDPTKGKERLLGPCPITEVRTNGAVRIKRENARYLEETLNIRKLQPHKGPPVNQINENNDAEVFNLFIEKSQEFARQLCHYWIPGGEECNKLCRSSTLSMYVYKLCIWIYMLCYLYSDFVSED